MSKYIYMISRFDFYNNRKEEESTVVFGNTKAAADYIALHYGKDVSYYQGWSKKNISTKKEMMDMMDNIPTGAEYQLWKGDNVANTFVVKCMMLHNEWK